MAYGVTETGFAVKPLPDTRADIESDLRALIGNTINLAPETVLGQLVGIMSDRVTELWDQIHAVYAARDPDQATGAALDAIAAITGTTRKPATRSRAVVTATGTAGTLLPAGRVVAVPNGGPRFSSDAAATLVAATAWLPSIVYALGARRANAGSIYEVVTPGTSASSGGPTGNGLAIVDGTVTWRWLGDGAAWADVGVTAEDTGPLHANAGTLTDIQTPLSGWTSVTNAMDAVLGADIESDAGLRQRRVIELRSSGNAALDAMRGALLNIPNVTAVTIFENAAASTNEAGMPPHSIEAMVTGGDPDAIAAELLRTKPAGIQAYGLELYTPADSQGTAHDIRFSRPDQIAVWVAIHVKVELGKFPADGPAQIVQAVVDYAHEYLGGGRDVVASAIGAQAFKVSGVFDVVSTLLSTAPAPAPGSPATIVLSPRQIALIDTARVDVTVTGGTV